MPISNPENIRFNNKNISGADLAGIVQEHPYFSLAQFWLLSDYYKNTNKDFQHQASITALFFNNHRWLKRQLSYHSTPDVKDADSTEPVSSTNGPDFQKQQEQTVIGENKIDGLVAFEPLHTVDYFASQGIRITEDPITNDKLGTQLKSFTEWLKSMKKIHAEKIAEGDEQTDKKIRHIAESSNVHINVVTEAMAEVLLKQGKIEQAIEMYEKLSLNYPSGNAYFAAKINSLKSV